MKTEKRDSREKILEAMVTMIVGFIVLFLVFKIKIFLTIALIVGLIALFSDFLSEKLNWLWMKIAMILGYVNGRILLSAVFFIILTPMAFLSKIKKKSALHLEKGSDPFEKRNHKYTPEDFENTW